MAPPSTRGSAQYTMHLVGREREQEVLRHALDAALDGRGGLALVSGEAGIGKTTLVRWLIDEARDRGALVITGGCYDLTTTSPYGPWSEALREYRPSDTQPSVPAWFGNPEEMGRVGSQTALFEEARVFFTAVATYQPLVIVLEDLHWADPASLDALRYLARTLTGVAILLIVTYRDDEITRRHPLFQLLPLITREPGAVRVELQRLDADAIRELVMRERLSEAETSRLGAYLEKRTLGNPLFITELLRALELDGTLQVSAGGATLGELDEGYLPAFVLQVIERRLTGLDAGARRALEIAAVIGQEVPFEIWEAVSGRDEMARDVIIEQAIELHILEETPDHHGLRFIHALVREVLYEGVIPTRRWAWHRQAGEALEHGRADPDAIAFHFQQAGDERAVEWLVKAGDRAERSYAWISAAERFEAAAERLEGIENRAGERGWLLWRLAILLRWTNPEQGVVYHEEAMRLGRQAGDRGLVGLAQSYRGLLMCFAGRVREGLVEMEAGADALDALTPGDWDNPTGDVNPVKGALILWLGVVGRYRECIGIGERLLPEYEGFEHRLAAQRPIHLGDGPTSWAATQLGSTCMGLHKAYSMLGNLDEAAPSIARAISTFKVVNHHGMVANAAMDALQIATLRYHADDLSNRKFWASEAVAAQARAQGAMRDDVSTRMHLLPLLVIEGAWDEVNELAARHQQATANVALHVIGMAALGTVARYQGQPGLAWRQVYEALPLGPQTEPGEREFFNTTILQRLAADLALDNGDLKAAREWIEAHDRWLRWSGAVLGRAEHEILWARYDWLAGDLVLARRHAEQALQHASDPRQPLTLIAAQRFLGQLNTLEGRHDDAQTHLTESLGLAEACETPHEQALTLLALAELGVATGNMTEVRVRLEQVRAICEPLDAKPALARVAELEAGLGAARPSYPAGLTPREVEVLALLAAGRSNRQIANDLFLSSRTVERHVTNIYRKIDVHNRAEATAFALANGLA